MKEDSESYSDEDSSQVRKRDQDAENSDVDLNTARLQVQRPRTQIDKGYLEKIASKELAANASKNRKKRRVVQEV